MFTALFILLIGLAPSLLSAWVLHHSTNRVQARLQLAMDSITIRQIPPLLLDPDYTYTDGVGYIFGDLTCRYNARSGIIRCAVNPSGPCQDCSHYEPRDI